MSIQGEFFEKPREVDIQVSDTVANETEAADLSMTIAPRESKRGMKDLSIPKLYYSISEVSRLTGLEQYVLRYWETEFDELRPQKNRAGNRIYSNKDIKFILKIKELLREKRYTIEGAKHILKTDRASEKDKAAEEAEIVSDPAQLAIAESNSAAMNERANGAASASLNGSGGKQNAPAATNNVSLTLSEIRQMKEALLTLKNTLGRHQA